jgi:hypothetical protein
MPFEHSLGDIELQKPVLLNKLRFNNPLILLRFLQTSELLERIQRRIRAPLNLIDKLFEHLIFRRFSLRLPLALKHVKSNMKAVVFVEERAV